MTGSELKAHRLAAGLSRPALATQAGVCSDAVKYWEGKATVDLRGWAVSRILSALGLGELKHHYAPARGWGVSAPVEKPDLWLEAQLARLRVRQAQRAAQIEATRRVLCGAKTRKGAPCRLLSEPGRRRCKFHGGKSTGPKTAEGRARIAEAQRRRWARWQRAPHPTRPGVLVGFRSLALIRGRSASWTVWAKTPLGCSSGFQMMGFLMGMIPNPENLSLISRGCGGPGAIRTPGPQIRSLMLYPAELRVHCDAM